MFERYTERARRVIFFARYEASQFGSDKIEAAHILLGLLREDQNVIKRFVAGTDVDIKKKVEAQIVVRTKISTSIDLPLTDESKRILAYAHEEAERLNHRHIGTEHLLLGMLRESACLAARILAEAGIKLDEVRVQLSRAMEFLEAVPEQGLPPPDLPSIHALVDQLPENLLAQAKWMLERLLADQSGDPGETSRPGWLEVRTAQKILQRDTEGKMRDGHYSSTRRENETTVVETHHFCNGHQISVTERFRLGDDGKTLSYSQEVVGPKPEQQHKHAMEFDVS